MKRIAAARGREEPLEVLLDRRQDAAGGFERLDDGLPRLCGYGDRGLERLGRDLGSGSVTTVSHVYYK